jgi:hypothetical protein
MSHERPVRMFNRSAVGIVGAAAFLVGAIASDGMLHTIRKDCPSGAAATVSHNRPVRMSGSQGVTAFLVGAIASDGILYTIRKDCPSGAAARVSHNRSVRMLLN